MTKTLGLVEHRLWYGISYLSYKRKGMGCVATLIFIDVAGFVVFFGQVDEIAVNNGMWIDFKLLGMRKKEMEKAT